VGLNGLRGGSWWVSVGCLARSGSGWVAGVSWWVCGVAHGGGATHGLPWVALKYLCVGVVLFLEGRKYVLVICENTYVKTIVKKKKGLKIV
jgi:hypothetical protein